MNDLIGLKDIQNQLNTYTIDTLPHSIIILGKRGSGKHLVTNYICNKFKLELIDISANLSDELIENIYTVATIRAYLIDLHTITEKSQNIILKLFEEPPANAFIFVLANNSNQILPTVLNRGFILNMPRYSYADLVQFANTKQITLNDKYKYVIETPGDILNLYSGNTDLTKLEDLIDKIETKLNVASYANTLTIANKLNYSDEYDKFDANLFIDLLCTKYANKYINENVEIDYKLYNIANDCKKKLDKDPRLNKKILITNLLSNLWGVVNAVKSK